jgi:predicted DNA-binding protein
MSTKTLNLNLDEDTWEKLGHIASAQGKNISEFVKEKIEEFLREQKIYEEIHQKLSNIEKSCKGTLEKWKRDELYRV